MARMLGINHVAIEVADVDEALAWYGRLFEFELRGRAGVAMAFIDLGDQFIVIAAGRKQPPDQGRHFGLVVDDKEAVRTALQRANVSVQASGAVDFLDPWGNHVQVVDYREIQFSKASGVLQGMGIEALEKTAAAREELHRKGLADERTERTLRLALARAPKPFQDFRGTNEGERGDSNPRPPGPQPGALPAELRPPRVSQSTSGAWATPPAGFEPATIGLEVRRSVH